MNLHNNKISSMIIGVVPQLFIVILLSGCVTYNLTNNKKFRKLSPIKDEATISSEEFEKYRFNIKLYHKPDTNKLVQYISTENINQIVDEISFDLLIIFYYPNCSEPDKYIEISKFAENHDIPYILISEINSPTRMKELYVKHELNNKNQYIIPTINNEEDVLSKKRLEFIKELCPECFIKQKDELIFSSVMIMSKNKNARVNPVLIGGYRKQSFLINWIKEEYGIMN
jgi:hypothetical protein